MNKYSDLIARAAKGKLEPADCAELTRLAEKAANLEKLAALPETERLNAELERLRTELTASRTERESAVKELTTLHRKTKIAQVAAEYNFTDSDYLDFLSVKRELALDDPDAVHQFMEELTSAAPKLFRVDLSPGAGGGCSNGAFPAVAAPAPSAVKDIAGMLESAPSVM